MITATWDPRREYRERLSKHQANARLLATRDGRLANARFVTFLIGIVLLGFALMTSAVHLLWCFIPLTVFVVLIVVHEVSLRTKTRAENASRYYERALARLDDAWAGKGVSGSGLAPANHPYAEDLDLFGEASLFELLCTVRTRAGEESLGAWLCEPASREEIHDRQIAVEELRHRLDLREDLALLGGEMRATVRPQLLVDWAQDAPVIFTSWERGLTWFLSSLGLLSLLGWAFFGFNATPLLLVIVAELIFSRLIRQKVAQVADHISEPVKDLEILAHVLRRLEDESFTSPKLMALQKALHAHGRTASARIAYLHKLLLRLDQRRNMVFAPFALVLLWSAHCAFALERWRKANGPGISQWLASVGECEALCALAAYAYDHPADPFPEVLEASPVYDGRAVGHPLLKEENCTRNDIQLDEKTRALIVSGSNMSGKSTLLRTVGINAVLAFAGAPVRAESLRLSLLALGATLRVQDSIQTGESRFYAEIRRLHQLMETAAGPRPLLFLLDEILGGTNSHDRSIGGKALIHGFLDRGAIGLITTHDLALTEAANGAPIQNVHFTDHLEGDRLVFDYRLRPGVVQKSNALELMRAIGLQV